MGAGVVATAGGPIVLALGISQTRMARLGATLLAERATCDRDVAERIAAERRRRDGLRQVEDARLRLERERTTLDQRVGRSARYVRLLAEGDAEATRVCRPHWRAGPPKGPLAELAAGLDRIRLRVATRQAAGTDSGQMVALISRAAAEQARLLALTDADLRDQGAAANQLVAALAGDRTGVVGWRTWRAIGGRCARRSSSRWRTRRGRRCSGPGGAVARSPGRPGWPIAAPGGHREPASGR